MARPRRRRGSPQQVSVLRAIQARPTPFQQVGGWQSCLDSNQDEQSQNLLCYRYTTGLEAPADEALRRAAPPGLEPGKTESKSVVLPLHQGALRRRGANARREAFVWQSGISWGFRERQEVRRARAGPGGMRSRGLSTGPPRDRIPPGPVPPGGPLAAPENPTKYRIAKRKPRA